MVWSLFSEFSKFDEHLPQHKIIYLFLCTLLVLLYSLVKTICSVISMFILGNACIGPYCMKIGLPLEESSSTLNCNPYLTKDYTFYPTDNQTIVYPVTGMNNYKHGTKGHRNTTADNDAECLSNNTTYSSLNRTVPSVLSNIDPDTNYLSCNTVYNNTRYLDDQHFRDKFKSNKNISMFHLNIRSIPEHFIELASYIDSLDIVFKFIAISETWLKPYHADYIILNYNAEKDIRFYKRGGGVSLYIHSSLQYKLRNDFKIGTDSETINSVFVEVEKKNRYEAKPNCWLYLPSSMG